MNTTVQDENGNSQNAEIEEVQALDENETDIEVIKAHAVATEDRNKQLFARAKKAEGFVLTDGKWVKPEAVKPADTKPDATISKDTSDISQTDLYTLIKADVAQEDIEQVVEYAKFKKITVAEALNDEVIKGILAGKAEARNVAEGTNTGGAPRGNARLSDQALLENAKKGIFPDSDEDMARLTTLARAVK